MATQDLNTRQRAATVIQAHFRRWRAQKQYRHKQTAACTIQAHATRFLARRKAAREHEQEQRSARFKAVMARHQERIQQLELEKKSIRELAVGQLDAWQARRHAAAVTIQAHWRGSQQRQHLKLKCPALMTLRPVACPSPTFKDQHSPKGSSSRMQHSQLLLHSVTAAGTTDILDQEPSAASVLSASSATAAAGAGHNNSRLPSTRNSHRSAVAILAGGVYGMSSASACQLAAEASSCLSAEASKLSAVGAAVFEEADAPKRSTAIPAARRMVLERQVQLRVDAFKATGSSRLAALRANQHTTDQRLVALLQDHHAAAAQHLKAARRRQKLLQEAEVLHSQLQQLPQLSQLPDIVTGAHFSLPHAGSTRAEWARQAHALSLAEARVGSKWWQPLKVINQQHKEAFGSGTAGAGSGRGSGSVLHQDWQQQEAAWKSSWERIRQEEEQRPSPAAAAAQQAALRPQVVIEQQLSSESSWHPASVCEVA